MRLKKRCRRHHAKRLIPKLRESFIYQIMASVLGILVVLWSVTAYGFILFPNYEARAAGGGNIMTITDGGNSPDIFIDSVTAKAVVKISAFETQAGTNKINSVTIDAVNQGGNFAPVIDLAALAGSAASGLSLYQDANSNGVFDAETDTLLSFGTGTPSDWSVVESGYRWRTVVSNLDLTIPSSYGSLNLFVVLKITAGSLDQNPLKRLNVSIPKSGVDVTVANGSTLTDFPVDNWGFMSEPIVLGAEGGQYDDMGSPILISEIQTAGGTGTDEFIELYNRSANPVDLTGFRIGYWVSTASAVGVGNWTSLHVIGSVACNPNCTIPGNAFFLLKGSGYDGGRSANEQYAFDLDVNGIVAIYNPAGAPMVKEMDKVGYGTLTINSVAEGSQPALASSVNGSIERKAFPDSTASKMSSGIHMNQGNGEDSNNNAMDFVIQTSSNPENNTMIETPGGMENNSKPVVINEVLYNTTTGNGWIEIFNKSGGTVDLFSWKLKSMGKIYTFPAGKSIASNSLVVIYWNKTGTDTSSSFYTSNGDGMHVNADMGTYGGDVFLVNNTEEAQDYVEYGGPNFNSEASAVLANMWMDDTFVPQLTLSGESIGRRYLDGSDYNDISDWQVFSTTTPGFPNMGGDSTAPTAVTGVTLADNDFQGGSVSGAPHNGLTGWDITISWTSATVTDPSFAYYELYILPATVSFDGTIHNPIDSLYGPQTNNTYTGADFVKKDSAGNNLGTGSYRGYVIAVDFAGNSSSSAVSSPSTLIEEVYSAGDDHAVPFIMHMPAWQSKAGVALVLNVRAADDRMLDATHPLQIVWKAGSDSSLPNLSSGTTSSDCVYASSDVYSCTITWDASWGSTTRIGYYLKAKDGATTPNYSYFYAADNPSGTIEATAIASPFIVDILAGNDDPLGDYTDTNLDADLSGTVYKSNGLPLEGAKIAVAGTTLALATTDSNGIFIINDDLLVPGPYNIMAFKDGYMDVVSSVYKGDSGLSLYMNEGTVNMQGGGDKPFITWTAPMDGTMGAPRDIYCTGNCSTVGSTELPIIIGFSKAMNANNINDEDASNGDSNIYLTTNGTDRVTGKVYYSEVNREARFYASEHNTLASNTAYTIVVTTKVRDTDGNPVKSNTSSGDFISSFTTMGDNSAMWGTGPSADYSSYGQGGMAMPPFVKGTTPADGTTNAPINTSVIMEFSEPMENSTVTSSSNIKLFPVTNTTTWTTGTAVSAALSLDSNTQRIVKLDPTSNLTASTYYILRIYGAVKSATGVWMGNPTNCVGDVNVCLATVSVYEMKFKTGTVSDESKPTVIATIPGADAGMSPGALGVDVGIPGIEVGFSEAMDPSTINSQYITLKSASDTVVGKVKYDPMGRMAKFIPKFALSPNTRYTLTVTTGTTDLAGNSLDQDTVTPGNQDYSMSFKTGAPDTASPKINYANADDYSLAVTFSEAMNESKNTENKWTGSVLNKDNYTIRFKATSCGTEWNTGGKCSCNGTATAVSLTNASVMYDASSTTAIIEGMSGVGLAPGTEICVYAQNVADTSNNTISSSYDTAVTKVSDSKDTYGMLGPEGKGMMMGSSDSGPGMNMGTMGMMKAGAFPMNSMAGATTMYFVDVPVSQAIDVGGKIILTYPTGFNVASAAKDPNSPMNNDINGPSTGAIGFNVTADQGARTIIVTLTGAGTQVNDFLHFDLKSIVNTSIPKEFGTDGYSVDIKTFDSSNKLLQSLTTMPFFISASGTNTISGTITASGATTGTMLVFLGSPMTGPMETTVNFATLGNGTATYSFANLPNGQYMLFTEPSVTLGATTYSGKTMPDSVWVNGSETKTVNLTLEANTAGVGKYTVTVRLVGDFRTNGVNDQVDIFAGSPNGFMVKTVTPGITSGTDYEIYLRDGDWMIGIGPAENKGAMSTKASAVDWVPPMPTVVKISSNGAAIAERSDTANDGIILFNLGTQLNLTLPGKVVDGSGNGIADADVFAYQPQGGFGGAFTRSAADGTFSLKIQAAGSYTVGSFKPGLPPAKEVTVNVTESGNYLNGTLLTIVSGANPFFLKMQKPAYTISGKVLNSSGDAVSYTPVWTYQQNNPGNANTMTDATGNYILYVDNGTWIVETDIRGEGWVQYESPVTINGASESNINLQPDASVVWYNISGTVTINGAAQANMPIRAAKYNANGSFAGQQYGSITNSSGAYTIKAPAGIYRVDIWTPEYGEVERTDADDYPTTPANLNLTADKTGVNITVGAGSLNDVTVVFTNKSGYSGKKAFLNIDQVTVTSGVAKPTGYHYSTMISDVSGADKIIKLKNGDYFFFVDIPGYGFYKPNIASVDGTKHTVVVSSAPKTVTFDLPDLADEDAVITLSGAVSGPSVGSKNAWIWVGNPETAFHTGIESNATTGAYSIVLPKLSSGNYMVGADKPEYIPPTPTSITGTADTTVNFTLTAASYSISGYLFADTDGGTANSMDAGEAVANGWVRAREVDSGLITHSPVDGAGAYKLSVNAGSWKVYGNADGYQESQYSVSGTPALLTVSTTSLTNKNIKLTASGTWENKVTSSPITPSSGGIIDDTAADGTGVKVTIPANALGSSSSAGTFSMRDTTSITSTSSTQTFGDIGKTLTAADNNGQPITNLNDYINLDMVYYKADVDASGLSDLSHLKDLKISYFDNSLNDWVSLPTVREAYYKLTADTEWKLYNGDGTLTGFEKFIDDALVYESFTDFDDYMLMLKAATNHLTVFGATLINDGDAPAAPSSLSQTSGNGTTVVLDWANNSEADLLEYEVYRSTSTPIVKSTDQINTSAVTTSAYTNTTATAWTSYYYGVTAVDDSGNESTVTTLRMCSTKTVSNGTVASDCVITCNSGYTANQTDHTCNLSGGGCSGGICGGDSTPPLSLTNVKVTSISSKAVITWDDSASSDFNSVLIYRDHSPSAGTINYNSVYATVAKGIKTYTDTNVSSGDTYQYVIRAKDNSGNIEQNSTIYSINVTKEETKVNANVNANTNTSTKTNVNTNVSTQVNINADVSLPGGSGNYLPTRSSVVDLNLEKKAISYFRKVFKSLPDSNGDWQVIHYISYGVIGDKLGKGEREAIINDFKNIFGQVPSTDKDWQDIDRLANGLAPLRTNSQLEKSAEKVFIKIYNRLPKTISESDAVKWIAYKIRPEARDLEREKAGIKLFMQLKSYGGQLPSTSLHWAIVRVLSYFDLIK